MSDRVPRLPRVIYQPMPEGQDWSVTRIADEDVVLINELLDDGQRRAARRAAFRSIRGIPAWVPIPVVAAGDWLSRKARGPMGSAAAASILTAAAFYGITALDGGEHPIAQPPSVVTVTGSPTAARPPDSPSPSARSTRSRPPEPSGHKRSDEPAARAPATSTRTARPTRTTPPAAASPSGQAQVEDVAEEPSQSTPPSAAETSATQAEAAESAAPAAASEPPPQGVDAATCGGVALDVRLDPLPGVNACLLG